MASFEDWLREVGLERYAAAFADNDIDFGNASALSEVDLKELGLTLGHRKNFLAALAARASSAAPSPAPTGLSGGSPASEGTPAQAAPAGERRQITVMFCDLVGSTALSERLDPEELRALLHEYRSVCGEVIARYEGFVARYVGDGILTYFGWPKAHEDDAERSVRAGLEILQAIKRLSRSEPLSVRIGIATGPVVVGEEAEKGDQAKLAVGATPNLAARLQGLASAGQIVIAAATRRLVGDAFELSDLGEHRLKDITEPVHAWAVVKLGEAANRFEASHGVRLMPLVGREQEIGLLLDRWQLSREGEGQVVLLSGEPGIGKSRIQRALRERLKAQGAQVLDFQCSPYHVNSVHYPTIDNFERELKLRREGSLKSKLDKLETVVVGRYGRPVSDVPLIAAVLSIDYEARYGALALTPRKQKDETLRALVDLTEAVARHSPTVMIYEDVHWADPTSLEVLDLLIERVSGIPLLIVLTHRPEFRSRWSDHGHVSALNLSKLTRSQSSAMVSRLAGGKALPAELLEQILAKTDGVPLYVEELTKSILESGGLRDAGDRYDYAGTAHGLAIPATLRDSLMARLDRLLPVKEIAQIGAAIGREFSYELVSAVAPHAQAELDRALEQLTESGLAFRRGTPPEATYTFKHALVQDAAYDSLLKARRQALHARIARALEEHFPATRDAEPEFIAHHLTAAGEAEAAIGYWRKAGTLALKQLALNEAISHLNKGMELIVTLAPSAQRDASELELRTPLGTAWLALKGWGAPEVWSNLHPALGLAKALGRHEALVSIYFGLHNNVLVQGRAAETLDWVNEMLASAEARGDSGLRVVGHRAACNTYYSLGDFDRSREHGEKVLALYDEVKHRHLAEVMNMDPKTSAGIYLSLDAWMLGYPDHAAQVSEANDAHARRRGHPYDLGYALTHSCQVLDLLCEPARLLALAEEAERLGRAHRLLYVSEVLAQIFKGLAWLRAGRLAEGIPHFRGAIEKWSAGGALLRMPYFQAVLAEGLALSGDRAGALRLVEDSLGQVERPGWEERCHLAEILRLKGWILSLEGDLEGAEHNYLASLDCARAQKAKSWELRTATSLAKLWQGQGKRTQARELLAPVYAWFTEGFGTRDLREAKALLGELA